MSHLPVLPSHQSRLYEASATRYGHQEPILSKTSDGCGQAGRYPSFPFDFFFLLSFPVEFLISAPYPLKHTRRKFLSQRVLNPKKGQNCVQRETAGSQT